MEGDFKKIRLSAEDVCEFVSVANLCEFPIQVSSDRCKVNAKCLEDMIMLDFSHLYEVIYNGYDHIFEHYLKRIAVA